MSSSDFKIIPWVLAVISFLSTSYARLSPPGEAWIQKFEPPYADHTLKIQLRNYEWWTGPQEKAVIPKGTEYPIVDEQCSSDRNKCRKWKLPSDIKLYFGPESPQDISRLNIFLTDTGARVPIYSAPYEKSTPGCTGKPDSVCCGGNEFTLHRDEEQYKVVKMWVSRFNGSVTYTGNQPSNFRSAGAKLTVYTGQYSGTVVWDNMFHQKVGVPQPGNKGLKASIDFFKDTREDSYQDVGFYLTHKHTLLIPVSDPKAPGFVVPNDELNETPAPLDMDTWRACRTSRCSTAPAGFCKGVQGPTPYASRRETTTAKVIAEGWNTGTTKTYKYCSLIGTGRKQFMNDDLTMGATHDTQFISCTYTGTYLVPFVMLPRSLIEAANPTSSPPSPSPIPSPSPSPIPSPLPSPNPSPPPTRSPSPSLSSKSPSYSPSSPTASTAQTTAAPPPPVPLSQANGPAISLVVTLPTYTPTQFNSTGKAALLNALKYGANGFKTTPYIRYRIITPAASYGGGTTVDCVVYFAKIDELQAGLLLTHLQEEPGKVFSQNNFGAVKISRARKLGCVVPCGPNGAPGPVTRPDKPDTVACSCECDPGWSTQPNQDFDTWVYCMVKAATSSPSNSTSSTSSGGTSPDTNESSTEDDSVPHAMLWRPPVPKYPPPPPIQFKESSGGVSIGTIVGILVALLIVGFIGYWAWRTGCSCCCTACTSCFAFCWHCCSVKGDDEAGQDDEDIEAAVTRKKRTAAAVRNKSKQESKAKPKPHRKKETRATVRRKKRVKSSQTQPIEEEEEEEEIVEDEEESGEDTASDASEEEEEEEVEEIVSPRAPRRQKSQYAKKAATTRRKRRN